MKARAKQPKPMSVKCVLLATDFSELAVPATSQAVFFAQRFAAELVLLHVIETFPIDYVVGLADSKKINAAMEEKARERLAAAAREIHGVPVRTLVRWGKPFQEIVGAARELGADLIVLSTHGRTGLKHMYLGSTAEQVVRHARCTVVVARS